MPDVIYLLIGAGTLSIAIKWFKIWQRLRPNAYHRQMRKQFGNALKLLQARGHENPGAIISYLRKMNPHAVEEIILDAAEAAGHKVKRNSAYTGDGGVDGEILVDGVLHLVQIKRYAKTINPQHVTDFGAVCTQRRQPGLVIHCGRTGDKSRENKAAHVKFVSGTALIDLIRGKSLNSPVSNQNAA